MKTALSILALTFCTSLFAQKDVSYHSFWHETDVDDFISSTIDFTYSDKGKIYFCISNDKDNIYVNLRIFQNEIQRGILSSGVTIWVNTDGKKGKKMGIKYPYTPEIREKGNEPAQDRNNQQRMPQRGGNTPGARNMAQPPAEYSLQLLGFSESGPITINPLEKDTFKGSIRIQKDKNMYYQVIMPISKLPVINDQPSGKKKTGAFVLGITYTPALPSAMGGYPGGGQGRPSGGGGGGGGGRMSGGGGGGGMQGGGPGAGSNSGPIKTFWITDIRLAPAK